MNLFAEMIIMMIRRIIFEFINSMSLTLFQISPRSLSGIILCLLLAGCQASHTLKNDHSILRSEKRGQEARVDSLHLVALEGFVASNNYNGASLYLERRTVPYDIRIRFIDFLMKGAMQKGVGTYNPAALGLSVMLERGDVNPTTAASIMDLLEKDSTVSYLYPKLAELAFKASLPLIANKFSKEDKDRLSLTKRHAAIALAIWEKEEAVTFILETCKNQMVSDRRAIFQGLLPGIRNLKRRAITEFIISEFVLSDICYDYNDPGVVPWCETDIVMQIDVIQEFNQFLAHFKEGTKPGNEELRDWFQANKEWHYVDHQK